jgi:cysteine desulfurase
MAIAGAGRRRLLVSAIEHESVLSAAPGAERIAVDRNGVVDLAALDRLLARGDEPTLVSVMLANNETGVVQPVAEVARLSRRAGALVHCDAVQAAGKLPVDFRSLGVDYLSLSAHKLGGPTGVGALVVCNGAPFAGDRRGGSQEARRRAGTENVAGIAGFAAAAGEASGGEQGEASVSGLRDRMEAALLAVGHGARVFGSSELRLPNTTCISMPGVKAETQVMALDLAGVCVSAGAACSSGKVQRSVVLAAMGVEDAVAETAIRISLGWSSRAEEIDRLIAAWRDLYVRVVQSGMPSARAA